MPATFLALSLQVLGTAPDLQFPGDPNISLGNGLGHITLPTIVTPTGANVCPAGQKMGVRSVTK
jgi:hypothetical protein